MRTMLRKVTWKRILFFLAILFIIFAGVNDRFMDDLAQQEAEKTSQRSIDHAKEKLETFNNYSANDETKSLVRLLDKTVAFSHYMVMEEATPEGAAQFLREQRLKGILVLNDNLQIERKVPVGDVDFYWPDLIHNNTLLEIIRSPKKVYMARITTEGETYDVAVVARNDKPGVIISYMQQNTVKAGVNDITIDNIFTGMMPVQGGLLMVSHDGQVMAASSDNNYQTIIDDWAGIWDNGKIISDHMREVKYDEKSYYAQQSMFHAYTIHILLPKEEIRKPYYFIEAMTIFFFFLFCVALFVIAVHSEQKHLKSRERFYQIIAAENEVYLFTMLVELANERFECFKVPPQFVAEMGSFQKASEIFTHAAEHYVMAPYKEPFLQFTDLSHLADRLKDKKVLSLTYESTLGYWFTIQVIPQRRDAKGRVEAVLFLFSDVTEDVKKEKEQQKQLKVANEAKDNFLRRMSHDIRTPINGIQGIIQIAEHRSDDLEAQKKALQKVKNTSKYLLDLLNNILDMGKLESSEVKLEHKPFHVLDVLKRLNEIVTTQCQENGITYHVGANAITHAYLMGSPIHVQRILMNLASNAVKYNKANGDIFVDAREVSATEDTAVIEFSIRDTGIGMSEEYQKHVFEPFTQEHVSARTNYAGTGLGMTITKELVEKMGGTITLESKQGVGTHFTVQIPFAIDRDKEAPKEQAGAVLDSLKGVKVLLVEDNELNMEIAEFMLEEKEATVTKAWNGQEALDTFQASEPGDFDVILMDIMMPVMGGWDATKKIRALPRADAKTIPIIAMSANAFQDDIAKSLQVGMNAHVTKPIQMEVLMKKLTEWLGKK